MNYNIYALERMAHDINIERTNSAKQYRLWQKARKMARKPAK